MNPLVDRIRDKIEDLRRGIVEICAAVGRDPEGVQLCAVSKYATAIETAAIAQALHGLGLPVLLGESRIQDLSPKAAELAQLDLPIRWELIGTLQRNKARAAMRVIDRIQSLDRRAICETLSRLAVEEGTVLDGFLQIKTSGEDEKSGFAPNELREVLEYCHELEGLRITGLMTMAARGSDHESARSSFALLRELRDEAAPELHHLSMGMSNDWRGAVREGATMLRIGSALH